MSEYKITVGLEIHAELKTESKMFCGCRNSPDEGSPNAYTCPICLGHPGTLPTINKEAVRKVLLVGTALNGKIADFTEFDRKNYFYPDIPKGYQISQYKYPLIQGGILNGVEITRIHLEEDTARSTHDSPEISLVDFNRAGVPLMELVTEPVIKSSKEAMNFAKELQLLLQYLDVSEANMEKGEMRVEVNISISKTSLGTKVEVKNINSFKAVGKAIDFEFERQKAILEKGEIVVQETRGWDENKEITFSQRGKENAHDYRYFPEPDLPKLNLSEIPEFTHSKLKESLPDLPEASRKKLREDFDLKLEDIETYINNKKAREFFDSVFLTDSSLKKEEGRLVSNYIISDILGLSKAIGQQFTIGKIKPQSFAKVIKMITVGQLSSRGAKDILKIMFEVGGDPESIAVDNGLIQKSDESEIRALAEKILKDNPQRVVEYKAGKESLLQFFVGVAMKEMKGSLNPEIFKKIILELLRG